MYKILGVDGKEYGPVTADVIRQWITERRADANTRIQSADTSEWKPLAEFPEFAATLNIPPQRPAAATPPPLISKNPQRPKKTSGLAIASLVLGVMGFCGITALIGLILGIVAQVKISRSRGELQGGGLAIAGICVSGFMLFLSIPIMAGLLLPALAKAKNKSQSTSCLNNMKHIGLAVRLYAEEHDGRCPPAATWSDAIVSNLPDESVMQCPVFRGEKCAFGFNGALSEKPLASLPPDTVLLFEAPGGCNYFGGPDAIAASPPHNRHYLIGFADGSVRPVKEEELATLRWEP